MAIGDTRKCQWCGNKWIIKQNFDFSNYCSNKCKHEHKASQQTKSIDEPSSDISEEDNPLETFFGFIIWCLIIWGVYCYYSSSGSGC
jgi:endogenous inhibitor of DNA gyrase (YacG/DUF329 family)